jgi:hypothetical protein
MAEKLMRLKTLPKQLNKRLDRKLAASQNAVASFPSLGESSKSLATEARASAEEAKCETSSVCFKSSDIQQELAEHRVSVRELQSQATMHSIVRLNSTVCSQWHNRSSKTVILARIEKELSKMAVPDEV